MALSTRRINQIQTDMLRTKIAWFRFLDENFSEVFKELKTFWETRNSHYVFDWTSCRMKMLDSQQYDAFNLISPTEQVTGGTFRNDRLTKLQNFNSKRGIHAPGGLAFAPQKDELEIFSDF